MSVGVLKPNGPDFFYPNRYLSARPWMKEFLKECKPFGLNVLFEPGSKDGSETCAEILRPYLVNTFFPYQDAFASSEDRMLYYREADLAKLYMVFSRTGKNIFHISPALVTMLSATSVDDICLANIKVPYPFFYLSFEKQQQLQLRYSENRTFYIEGAYFQDEWEEIGTITRISLIANQNGQYLPGGELVYDRGMDKKPGRNIKEDLDEENEQLRGELKEGPWASLVRAHEGGGEPDPIMMEAETKEQAFAVANIEVFQEAIKLIVNALCYISTYKEDVSLQFPSGAPKKLLEKLSRATSPKQKKKVLSELDAMGYTRIRICGQNIQQEYERSLSGREMKSHWRRGHWRNQAYGTGLSERRLLWIRPTLVRSDKGPPVRGHVYEI